MWVPSAFYNAVKKVIKACLAKNRKKEEENQRFHDVAGHAVPLSCFQVFLILFEIQ